jgi:hypothetical protein
LLASIYWRVGGDGICRRPLHAFLIVLPGACPLHLAGKLRQKGKMQILIKGVFVMKYKAIQLIFITIVFILFINAASCGISRSGDSALTGRWRSDNITIEFFNNGTASIYRNSNEEHVKWNTQDGRLILNTEKTQTYNFEFGPMRTMNNLTRETLDIHGFILARHPFNLLYRIDGSGIYGTWADSYGLTSGTPYMVFNENKTGWSAEPGWIGASRGLLYQIYEDVPFEWSIDGSNLTIVYQIEVMYDYALVDSTLTIFGNGQNIFTRLGS